MSDLASDPIMQSDKGIELEVEFNHLKVIAHSLIQDAQEHHATHGALWKRHGGHGAWFDTVCKLEALQAALKRRHQNAFDVTYGSEFDLDHSLDQVIVNLLLIKQTRIALRELIAQHPKVALADGQIQVVALEPIELGQPVILNKNAVPVEEKPTPPVVQKPRRTLPPESEVDLSLLHGVPLGTEVRVPENIVAAPPGFNSAEEALRVADEKFKMAAVTVANSK